MSKELQDLKTRITSLSNEELLDMVYVHSADYHEEVISFAKEELKKRNIEKVSEERIIKQSHILHSLLAQSREDIIKQTAKSISHHFNVPIEEAMEKCTAFIAWLFIHTLHSLIIEEETRGQVCH